MRDATVPRRAGALHRIAAKRPRFGIVNLHVELRVVFNRLARFWIEPLRPVYVVEILRTLDESAVRAINGIVKPVTPEVTDDLAIDFVDHRVVQHVDTDLVVIPRVVRRVLEIPCEL